MSRGSPGEEEESEVLVALSQRLAANRIEMTPVRNCRDQHFLDALRNQFAAPEMRGPAGGPVRLPSPSLMDQGSQAAMIAQGPRRPCAAFNKARYTLGTHTHRNRYKFYKSST